MADHPKRLFFPYRPYLRPTGRLPAAFSGASRRQPPLEIGAEMLRLRRAMARTGLESVRIHANRRRTASEHQYFGPYRAFLYECCRYPLLAGDVVDRDDDFFEAYRALEGGVRTLANAGVEVKGRGR